MSDQAVTNSTCLIVLDRIGQLDILPKMFSTIFAPPAVETEVGLSIAWLTIQEVSNLSLVSALQTQLHNGEAYAIALATEIKDSFLILDDKKARRIATQMGLKVIGTVGIFLRAKQQGIISLVKPHLDSLQGVGFHMTDTIYKEALRLAGEDKT